MPIHLFDFSDNHNPTKLTDMRSDPKDANGNIEARPAINPLPLQDGKPRDDIWFERQNVNIAEEVREILAPGFRTMDRGIKNYFSGLQVPTKDGIKLMGVRIAGGMKPYLIWAQDLRSGRVTLPVMAIKREGEESYPPKFSPAHTHYMSRRYLDAEGSRLALAYRPVPALLSYTLSVWAESKRDLEYINFQVRTRFNPVAEYMVEDEHLRGSVLLKYNGMTSAIDDEVPADQSENKRYDYSIQMEGWLPLPEKVVPTILGRVTTLNDGTVSMETGDILDVVTGKDVLASTKARTDNG